MTDPRESTSFDLTQFSEVVRRRLYERITEIQFDRPDIRHTPDQAKLQVVYLAGRWFAVWVDLDEPPMLPEALRVRIMRIGVRPSEPAAIDLHEV
jgi:hypothetical protein